MLLLHEVTSEKESERIVREYVILSFELHTIVNLNVNGFLTWSTLKYEFHHPVYMQTYLWTSTARYVMYVNRPTPGGLFRFHTIWSRWWLRLMMVFCWRHFLECTHMCAHTTTQTAKHLHDRELIIRSLAHSQTFVWYMQARSVPSWLSLQTVRFGVAPRHRSSARSTRRQIYCFCCCGCCLCVVHMWWTWYKKQHKHTHTHTI